jgi:hypothetical protein
MPRLSTLLALLTLVSAAAPSALGQPTLVQQFISPDPVSESRFGSGVAVDGDYIVVGEPGDLGAVGRAFVFVRTSGPSGWAFDAELIPASLEEGGEFDPTLGASVAFDWPLALVGAPYESDVAINSGAAYLFRQNDEAEAWVDVAKFKAPTPALADQFGFAVAISGATAAIGAPTTEGDAEDAGAVYLFARDAESGAWTLDQTLAAEDAEMGGRFGLTMDLAGDVLVVGASNGPGAVYVFERDGDAPWTQVQKLVPDDIEAGDAFGFDVATDGETIFAGAPLSDPEGQGSAYAFERTGPADAPWQVAQRLVSLAPQENAQFGAAVGVDGDRAVIGAPLDGTGVSSGAAYSFDRANGVWTPGARLSVATDDANAVFGLTLDLQSDLALIGSPGADGIAEANAGAAYAFAFASTAAEAGAAPNALTLAAPFPNPARGAATVAYALSAPADISLAVYDVLGREVAVLDRGARAAGSHAVRWAAPGAPPGLYLLRLSDGERTATRKLVVVR